MPLALAIIGGEPARFQPLVELYREAGRRAGQDAAKLRVSINSLGFVGDESRAAADAWYGPYAQVMTQLGRERGWPPMSRAQYEAGRSPVGALVLGSPDEVAAKIVYEHSLFRNDRFLVQLSVGTMPHAQVMRAIELLGTKVAPAVRKALG
jgi:alkanesulfonate monooxygenase SsuD/methylene tetrahydromethanopterin reductase-like flavin-dependent oxidoreductase (luciferase family)